MYHPFKENFSVDIFFNFLRGSEVQWVEEIILGKFKKFII